MRRHFGGTQCYPCNTCNYLIHGIPRRGQDHNSLLYVELIVWIAERKRSLNLVFLQTDATQSFGSGIVICGVGLALTFMDFLKPAEALERFQPVTL